MIQKSFFLILLLVFFVTSCSKYSSTHIGESRSTLLAAKGAPSYEKLTKSGTSYISYGDKKEAFELNKSGRVISQFRAPSSEKEKRLEHWVNLWENDLTDISKVASTDHHKPEIQFTNKDKRIVVIYSLRNQEVERIVHYQGATEGDDL